MIPSVYQAVARVQALFVKRQLDRELDEELAAHVEFLTDENIRRGMDAGNARREALLTIGSIDAAKELHREIRSLPFVEHLGQDLRYAVRQLRKNTAFTIAAALILAIGIGANAVLFSQVNAVFWTVLPVNNPEQLRTLFWNSSKRAFTGEDLGPRVYTGLVVGNSFDSFSYPAYVRMRDGAADFSSLACWQRAEVNAREWGSIEAQMVSGNYFQTLGVEATVGRAIEPLDDQSRTTAPVAVLSYKFWQKAFGASPSALHQTMSINGTSVTVIGVMPKGFFGLDPTYAPDVMVPIAMHAVVTARAGALDNRRDWTPCQVVGRLKPGIPDEQARTEVETLVQQAILEEPPNEQYEMPHLWLKGARKGLDSLRSATLWPFRVLMLIAGLVLLISCINIAGLLLARGTSRKQEIATRLALGAPRSRIVRQLLVETLLLWMIGGGAGITLAYTLSPLLPKLLSRFVETPITQPPILGLDVRPDPTVLSFSIALNVLTAIVFGLLPALRASRVDLVSIMKRAHSAPIGKRFHFISGKALIALQVAFSMLLLFGAGLFIRTLVNMKSVPMGFAPEGLLFFRIEPGRNGYDTARRLNFFKQIVNRLQGAPGVVAASGSSTPLQVAGIRSVCVPGYRPEQSSDRLVSFNSIAPGSFRTWQVPVLAGRDVTWNDREDARMIAVVNETFVKKYYSGRNPLEQRFGFSKCRDIDVAIVGVVADIKTSLRSEARPTVYVPYQQYQGGNRITLAVRTTADPPAMESMVRQIVAELDPDLPVLEVMTPLELRNTQMKHERQLTVLLAIFSFIALLLSCLGIYGMLAYSVNQRTSEIAVRGALGAKRMGIVRMIMRESIAPVGIGIGAGLTSAFALTHGIKSIQEYLTAMLFRVSTNDPWTVIGAVLLFLLTAAVAAALPAARVSRMDPMRVLHHE